MDRPAFSTLAQRRPPIEAPVVAWLQGIVNRSPHVFPKLREDGMYGDHTAQESAELLYRLGHPKPRTTITPADLAVVWQWSVTNELPADWRQRRLARQAKGYLRGWGITARSWLRLHPPAPAGGKLIVYSRSDAGLRQPRSVAHVPYSADAGCVVHWQGPGRGALGLDASFAQLRAWQDYHMNGHGWSDIGYNAAIPRGCPVGTVVLLRGMGARGAHCGHNVGNALPGVVVMFGEADAGPTDDQLATLALFRREFARGRVTGHNEWSPTSCPGPVLKAWISKNR